MWDLSHLKQGAPQALDVPISFDADSCGTFLGSLGSPRKLHILGVISRETLQLEIIGELASVKFISLLEETRIKSQSSCGLNDTISNQKRDIFH